jgi:transcriptional repressor NrdR
MKCGNCGSVDSKVTDSRDTGQDSIRRRRKCQECGYKFTTYEFVDKEALEVIKNNGERRPFDVSKIRAGISIACRKRNISEDTIDKLVADISQQLHNSLDKSTTSKYIGQTIMHALRDLDSVAYIRFASVYLNFVDVDSFVNFIKDLS